MANIMKINEMFNLFRTKNKVKHNFDKKQTTAHQICKLAIENEKLFDLSYDGDYITITIDYKIPKRFGNFDGITRLQVYHVDKRMDVDCIVIIGEYSCSDGTYDSEYIDMYLFKEKEQRVILNALIDRIKSWED